MSLVLVVIHQLCAHLDWSWSRENQIGRAGVGVLHKDEYICLRVDISYQLVYWHVICDASDVMGYDRRTPELAV